MKLKLLIFAGVAGIVLSGCQTERPATGKVFQKLGEQCQKYGFKPGSDQFAACIYQMDQTRISRNRASRMAFAQGLGQVGAQMQQNANNQAMINAMNRPRTCYTSGFGSTLTTRCY